MNPLAVAAWRSWRDRPKSAPQRRVRYDRMLADWAAPGSILTEQTLSDTQLLARFLTEVASSDDDHVVANAGCYRR